jgi:hypothetical protein
MKNCEKLVIVLSVICTIAGLLLIFFSSDIAFGKIEMITKLQGSSINKE